jgi:hypothetical protein
MIGAAAGNAVLVSHSVFYQVTFGAQVAFYAAAVAGEWTGAQALQIPAFLLSSNAAVLIAWLRFASGERIICWTPSERLTTLPQPWSH